MTRNSVGMTIYTLQLMVYKLIVNSHVSRIKNKEDSPVDKKRISTKIIDDVFTDEGSIIKPRFEINYEAYLHRLWDANLEIHDLLKNAPNIETSRDSFYSYLEKTERSIFTLENDLHLLEKATVRECVKVLRSIIAPINESRSKFSALDCLWKLAHDKREELTSKVSVGFLMEFINLFRGVKGKSNIYMENSEAKKGIPGFLQLKGRKAATARMKALNWFNKHRSVGDILLTGGRHACNERFPIASNSQDHCGKKTYIQDKAWHQDACGNANALDRRIARNVIRIS